MPTTLYAISYRYTAGLVALVSCEGQDLGAEGAPGRLLTALVGARFPISISAAGAPIEVPELDLACDPVKPPPQQDLEVALAEPHRFRVALDPDAPVLPQLGNGKEKILQPVSGYRVGTIALVTPDGDPAQVKVTLSSAAPVALEARLLFEGRSVQKESTRDPSRELSFTVPSDIAINPGQRYSVVFLMEGAPIEARIVRAPDVPTGATEPPATGTPPVTTPVRLPWTSR